MRWQDGVWAEDGGTGMVVSFARVLHAAVAEPAVGRVIEGGYR